MELPRLSVVLPNYNHGAFLPGWFDAVMGQSVTPAEVIVIDDASTDNSMEIIEAAARRYSTIRVLRNPQNRGVGFGVNRGLDVASGDFIHFSASDDLVLPGFFEKSMALLARHPRAALSCTVSKWQYVDTSLSWYMAAGMSTEPRFLSPQEMVTLGQQGRLLIVTQSTIMQKDALRAVGGFLPDLRWHCDWYAAYVTGFRHGICHVPEPLSQVNIHPRSYFQAGHKSQEHEQVLRHMLELLTSPACADVASLIRDSVSLFLFGMPLVRLLRSHPEFHMFLTGPLRRRAWRRSAEQQARRLLPEPLARALLKTFYSQRQA